MRAAIHLAVLAGCLLWTAPCMKSREHPFPGWMVPLYLASKLGCAAGLWFVFYEIPHSYKAAFVSSNVLIFAASLPLAWACLSVSPYRLRALALGVAIALFLVWIIVSRGEHCRPLTVFDGCLGMILAIPACVGAMTLEGKASRIAAALAFAWLMEVMFQFGYALHFDQKWAALNEWMPMAIACIGAIWLAKEATCGPIRSRQAY